MDRRTKIDLEAATVNELPPLSHWQGQYPSTPRDGVVMNLRGALPIAGLPSTMFARASTGATLVDIPLSEAEVRNLARVMQDAVDVFDAQQRGRAN